LDLVAGIAAATEALKLTKELRSIDRELDKAELKLRLVELTDRLLEAKEALQDAKEERRTLVQQLSDLEIKLRQKGRLVDERGLLYEMNDEGKQQGEPYCNYCYVKEERLYRLRFMPDQEYAIAHYWCDNCKNAYYK
jgi:chromosome segregation ATPase